MDFDGDSVSHKPLKSKEAVGDAYRIRSSLLFNFDYGMNFRRGVGKSAGQTYFSLGRDAKPREKTKHLSQDNEFVRYLLNLENGELDLEVLSAYTQKTELNKDPLVSIYDTVDIIFNGEKIKTTIGKLIVNRVLFYQLWDNKYFHYINYALNEKKIISEIKYVAQLIIENKVDRNKVSINRIIDLYQEVGLRLSTFFNASITYTMLNPDETFTHMREEIINSENVQKAIKNADVIEYQKAEQEIISKAKEIFKDDDMIELYESKGKADWNNDFKNMVVSQGAVPRLDGGKPVIISNPLNEGTPLEAWPSVINQGIVGATNRAVDTAKGGSQYKDITGAMNPVLGFDRDCGSTVGEKIQTNDMWDLLNRYVIEDGKSILVTLDNVQNYLGKEIEIRSPFHCLEKNGHYCSRCVGRTVFEMTGESRVALGMYTAEAASGVMNMFMKSTHNLGTSTFIIDNLNKFLYPIPDKDLFYLDKDPIDGIVKIYCKEDISWRVPSSAVRKEGIEYKILAHGSIISTKGKDYAMVLGTEIPSSPSEVLNPDQKDNEIEKHYIFNYYAGMPISNTNVTFREANTVYRMFNLFLQGNVSGLPPIESHKMTLMNAFKTNKNITASPITFDIILSTLARDANDLRIPARNTGGKNYKFVSCNDLTVMSGSFNALYGPDAVRGMVISAAKSYDEQTKNVSPIEGALRM